MSDWRDALKRSRKGLEAYAALLDDYPDVTNWQGAISYIGIAPIKSLGMLELQGARVTSKGLTTENRSFLDRSLMIAIKVNDKQSWNFERFSQREEPALALVKPEWDGAGTLTYSAPQMHPLILKEEDFKPTNGPIYSVRMTSNNDVYRSRMADERLSGWIRSFLHYHKTGTYDPDMVYVLSRPWGFTRKVEDRHCCQTEAETAYTDGGQLLVASMSTLYWMNECIQSPEPLCMDAFRPNIVLGGLPPNAEDVIDCVDIAGISYALKFGGLCVRCPVTQVVQVTGKKREDKEPLAWLAKNRPARPPENVGATFGVNAVCDVPSHESGILKTNALFQVRKEKS